MEGVNVHFNHNHQSRHCNRKGITGRSRDRVEVVLRLSAEWACTEMSVMLLCQSVAMKRSMRSASLDELLLFKLPLRTHDPRRRRPHTRLVRFRSRLQHRPIRSYHS
jgi:hypothetical protein